MTTDLDDPPLPLAAWAHTPESIPQGGLKTNRAATAEERVAIAAALDLVALERLVFDYAIKNTGSGVYRATGSLTVDVVQSCVVTLDPVPARIEETVNVEFRPEDPPRPPRAGKSKDDSADDGEPLDVDFASDVDIEPIENGRMDVGRIVFESLAAALDPYPRKGDAAFDWTDSAASAPENNPFAALAKLKANENKP